MCSVSNCKARSYCRFARQLEKSERKLTALFFITWPRFSWCCKRREALPYFSLCSQLKTSWKDAEMTVQIPLPLKETTGQSCYEGIIKLLAKKRLLQLIKYTNIFPKIKFTIMSYLHFQWKSLFASCCLWWLRYSGLPSEIFLEPFSCWSQRKYSSLRLQQRQ